VPCRASRSVRAAGRDSPIFTAESMPRRQIRIVECRPRLRTLNRLATMKAKQGAHLWDIFSNPARASAPQRGNQPTRCPRTTMDDGKSPRRTLKLRPTFACASRKPSRCAVSNRSHRRMTTLRWVFRRIQSPYGDESSKARSAYDNTFSPWPPLAPVQTIFRFHHQTTKPKL
jgi:hypothetical protein